MHRDDLSDFLAANLGAGSRRCSSLLSHLPPSHGPGFLVLLVGLGDNTDQLSDGYLLIRGSSSDMQDAVMAGLQVLAALLRLQDRYYLTHLNRGAPRRRRPGKGDSVRQNPSLAGINS